VLSYERGTPVPKLAGSGFWVPVFGVQGLGLRVDLNFAERIREVSSRRVQNLGWWLGLRV